MPILLEKWHDLTWPCIGPKLNLQKPTGFKMAMLTPKLDIGIGLSTKFQLKLSILLFGPNLPQMVIFSLQQVK